MLDEMQHGKIATNGGLFCVSGQLFALLFIFIDLNFFLNIYIYIIIYVAVSTHSLPRLLVGQQEECLVCKNCFTCLDRFSWKMCRKLE